MSELRFFERLRALEAEPKKRGRQCSDAVMDSIVRHLAHILNTRKGTVLLDPEFGLQDYTNFGSSFSEDTVGAVRRSIERLVRRYEPRIQELCIQPRPVPPEELELAFDISGVVSLDGGRSPLHMKTNIRCSGEVHVSRRDAV